jgi:hypothetical protein
VFCKIKLFVRIYYNRRVEIRLMTGSGNTLRKGDKKRKYDKENKKQINKASGSDVHNY